jgi:hypothetical protein
MILSDRGGVMPAKCRQDAKQTTTKTTAEAPTNAAFRQYLGAFETASYAEFGAAGCISTSAVET